MGRPHIKSNKGNPKDNKGRDTRIIMDFIAEAKWQNSMHYHNSMSSHQTMSATDLTSKHIPGDNSWNFNNGIPPAY